MKITDICSFRDLTLVPLSTDDYLVIACDSSAAIGEKPHDLVKINPKITAQFCLRVALMELLAFGATPLTLTNLVGNEYEPTGKAMIAGIKEELERAGFANMVINGSTEENIPTTTTSIGITVIGTYSKGGTQCEPLTSGTMLYQLGTPYVGVEVLEHLETIFSYQDLHGLRETVGVVALLPVGSKGILQEAEVMAASSQLTFIAHQPEASFLTQSCGPSTVLLIAANQLSPELIKSYALKEIGYFSIE